MQTRDAVLPEVNLSLAEIEKARPFAPCFETIGIEQAISAAGSREE
jgi:hypothetical protein